MIIKLGHGIMIVGLSMRKLSLDGDEGVMDCGD